MYVYIRMYGCLWDTHTHTHTSVCMGVGVGVSGWVGGWVALGARELHPRPRAVVKVTLYY